MRHPQLLWTTCSSTSQPSVRSFFQISTLNLLPFSLKPLPLVLSLYALVKSLSPAFLFLCPLSLSQDRITGWVCTPGTLFLGAVSAHLCSKPVFSYISFNETSLSACPPSKHQPLHIPGLSEEGCRNLYETGAGVPGSLVNVPME